MTIRPVRLKLSRRKGFNLQELSRATNGLAAVNVARPSRWGNPFLEQEGCFINFEGEPLIHLHKRSFFAADVFKWWLDIEISFNARHTRFVEGSQRRWQYLCDRRSTILASLPEIRGKNLGCFCKPLTPCHADVLLELANA